MGFMDIIPATLPKSLTSKTTFSDYILIVDAYKKKPKTLWYWIFARTKRLIGWFKYD